MYTSGSTLINSGTQSLNSFGSPLLGSSGSLVGSLNGGLGSLGTSIGSSLAGSAGSIDLIPGIDNWGSVIGAGLGSAPALLGRSAGAFTDVVSTLGTISGQPGRTRRGRPGVSYRQRGGGPCGDWRNSFYAHGRFGPRNGGSGRHSYGRPERFDRPLPDTLRRLEDSRPQRALGYTVR